MFGTHQFPATVIDLAVAFCRSLGQMVIQFEATFEHSLDAERLARAFTLLQQAHPVLGSRLVIKPWRAYWDCLPSAEHGQLVVAHDAGAYESFRTSAIEALRGPQIQACLFRHSDGDRLLLKTTHEVGDAGGGKEAMQTLAEIYQRLQREPDYQPEPNFHGSRGLSEVLRNIPLREFPGIFTDMDYWRDTLRMARQDAARAAPVPAAARATTDLGMVFPRRLIPKDRIDAAVRYGKRYGATINDLFLTAMFRSVAEARGTTQNLQLTQTVDLRRYIPGGRARNVGNLSGVEFIYLLEAGDSYAETLAKVVAITSERKRHFIGINGFTAIVPIIRLLPPPIIQRAMNVFIRRIVPQSNVPSILSNGGPIPTEMVNFDGPAQQAFMLPTPVYPPVFAAAMTGYQGTITLSSGTYIRPGDSCPAETFLDRTLEQLPG